MALGGLAPMIAPVFGGAVLTLGGTWRTVFWCLVGFGLLMMITAIFLVQESLPVERRHGGGLRQFSSGLHEVLRSRLFVGYMLTAVLSGFTMMAYIANSSYVMQEMNGLQPMPFALFFAATALAQILLSILNAKIVGRRFQPRTLIGFGLALATLAVAVLTLGAFALNTPLILTCAGFLVLMAVQAFIFGNASALAAAQTPHVAGAASAVLGVTQAVAMATSAPIASSGGATTAVPHDLGHDRRDCRLAVQLPRACPPPIQPGRWRSQHVSLQKQLRSPNCASIPCRGESNAWRPETGGRHPRSDGAGSR